LYKPHFIAAPADNDKPAALFGVENVNGRQQTIFQVPWQARAAGHL
jgi:hypothetical protein